MAYKVIIAEKPSVAAGIAKVVGATTPHRDKANGYLEGNGYKVTWAFGHLVGLQSPEQMGFKGDELPIIPDEWKTDIIHSGKDGMDAGIKKQMEIIEKLFKGAEKIIVATDA
ncbi:MAG: DNA topoisomerase III, partial [Firmicutes bacterium]|nr:DNA topoisomerase III [Bacillota bacterium]